MGLVKLIFSLVLLLFLIQTVSANSFTRELALTFHPAQDAEPPYNGFIEIDSTDVNIWPADQNCVAISFQNQLLPRLIENYTSEETLIYFPLQEAISADENNEDYKLLVGCQDENTTQENFEKISIPFDDFSDDKYTDKWVSFKESECLPINIFSLTQKSCGKASVTEGNSKLKITSNVHVDEATTAQVFLGLTSRPMLELKNNDLFVLEATCSGKQAYFGSYVEMGLTTNPERKEPNVSFFKRGCSDQTIQRFIRKINSEKIAVSKNGTTFSNETITEPFFLGFYVFTRSVRDKRQYIYVNQKLTLTKLVIFPELQATYPLTGGNAGQGFNWVNRPPEAIFLQPTEGRQLSLGANQIVFEFSDADVNQNWQADLGFHYSDGDSFDEMLASDLNLLDPSLCSALDSNATSKECSFDWNALSEGTIFLDLRVSDGFSITEKSIEVKIITDPPKVVIESPKSEEVVCSKNFTVKFNVKGGSQLNETKVRLDKQPWSSVQGFEIQFNNVDYGNHTVKVSVVDVLGRESLTKVDFLVYSCSGAGGGGDGGPAPVSVKRPAKEVEKKSETLVEIENIEETDETIELASDLIETVELFAVEEQEVVKELAEPVVLINQPAQTEESVIQGQPAEEEIITPPAGLMVWLDFNQFLPFILVVFFVVVSAVAGLLIKKKRKKPVRKERLKKLPRYYE
jgi:hypothetical protein